MWLWLKVKAIGLVGVVMSTLTLLLMYSAQRKGESVPAFCMCGALLPLSLATVILPPRRLYIPEEVNERPVIRVSQPNFTTLGYVFLLIGLFAVGGSIMYPIWGK